MADLLHPRAGATARRGREVDFNKQQISVPEPTPLGVIEPHRRVPIQ